MTQTSEIYVDIETTSLDADSGIIVAIGYAKGEEDPQILVLKSYADEQNLIATIFRVIRDQQIATYNGTRFDMPFLVARGLKYDLYFPKIEMVDLYPWAREYLRLQSRRFHDICLFYDIPHEDISGREVNELAIRAISGDNAAVTRIIRHLIQDIMALRMFHHKIKPLLRSYPPIYPVS